jgi:hypothetical protein
MARIGPYADKAQQGGEDVIPDYLTSLSGEATILIAFVSIAFGLLNCLFGYRIFRIMLAVYGFVLGAVVGFAFVATVAAGQTLWLLVGAVAGGLLGAVLMVVFYFVGVFFVGALAGALLTDIVTLSLGVDPPLLVLLVVALVAGVAALFFQRIGVILSTALGGAWIAVGGAFSLASGQGLNLRPVFAQTSDYRAGLALWLVLALWLALAIVGTIVQFRTTAEKTA